MSQSSPCDNCYHAWLTLMIYMTINVIYNVFILLVIKVLSTKEKETEKLTLLTARKRHGALYCADSTFATH
jgi:hypothetical protein